MFALPFSLWAKLPTIPTSTLYQDCTTTQQQLPLKFNGKHHRLVYCWAFHFYGAARYASHRFTVYDIIQRIMSSLSSRVRAERGNPLIKIKLHSRMRLWWILFIKQVTIYTDTVEKLVDGALKGYNATVLAYGWVVAHTSTSIHVFILLFVSLTQQTNWKW